jgi:glycosyltransferase involved in cell wall biosynthesis
LVRYRGQPIGWVSIGGLRYPVVSVAKMREAIAEQLGWKIMTVILSRQFIAETASNAPLAPISVIVCTRDRADQLERCLQAIMALDYPHYEIIVVDNASRRDDTVRLASRLPVRYVREEQPGLAWARNRGITEARHDIVAFTDDDARPDRLWLRAIARAFGEPEVMAVTGLVVPAELETTAQIRFEQLYGMDREFHRRTIRRDTLMSENLLWARDFGVGANMAFHRSLFTRTGPFDSALGMGTPSGGGGDIEMFHRIVARGYTLVYEPAALVWHTHRRDAASLRQSAYSNGRSFGAYLLTCARNRTVNRRSILRFTVRHWLRRRFVRRLRRPAQSPRHLIAIELVGALLSPLAYRAAQKRVRQIVIAAGTDSTTDSPSLPPLDQVHEKSPIQVRQHPTVDVL